MGREVKRVPMDFDWPLKATWEGFFNPYYKLRVPCRACDETGYSEMARFYKAQWYGNATFDPTEYGAEPLTVDHPSIRRFAEENVRRSPEFYGSGNGAIKRETVRLFNLWKNQWCHHLIQADVDALISSGRLHDFTHKWIVNVGWTPIKPSPIVTAKTVNDWSLERGIGHDSCNEYTCVRARCERNGEPVECSKCEGHGETWPSQAHKALYDNWEHIEPPKGDGYQMWETTSEGSPISPVFASAEELARWLVDTNTSAFGCQTADYESWLRVCNGGYAPSAVITPAKGVTSGVEGLTEPTL